MAHQALLLRQLPRWVDDLHGGTYALYEAKGSPEWGKPGNSLPEKQAVWHSSSGFNSETQPPDLFSPMGSSTPPRKYESFGKKKNSQRDMRGAIWERWATYE